jgi:hypothetical protein
MSTLKGRANKHIGDSVFFFFLILIILLIVLCSQNYSKCCKIGSNYTRKTHFSKISQVFLLKKSKKSLKIKTLIRGANLSFWQKEQSSPDTRCKVKPQGGDSPKVKGLGRGYGLAPNFGSVYGITKEPYFYYTLVSRNIQLTQGRLLYFEHVIAKPFACGFSFWAKGFNSEHGIFNS